MTRVINIFERSDQVDDTFKVSAADRRVVTGETAKHGDNGQAAQNNGVSAGLCHDLPLIAVLMDASRMSRCGFRPTLPCCQRSMTG